MYEQPIMTKKEFDKLMANVQQSGKPIEDKVERAHVVKYLDNESNKIKKQGIIKVAHGPSCWNGGPRRYSENNRVCWFCGEKHE